MLRLGVRLHASHLFPPFRRGREPETVALRIVGDRRWSRARDSPLESEIPPRDADNCATCPQSIAPRRRVRHVARMTDPSPHSPAGSFVAEPTYDREVVQMSPGWRRALRVLGVLVSFVLPVLSLHNDALGYDITCRATRDCTIVEHHLFRDITTTVAFEDIKVVQGHVEWDSDDGRRWQTGRHALTFNLVDGREIDASIYAMPEVLQTEDLRAYIKAPNAPSFTVATHAGWSDFIGIFAFFLGGLLLIALTLWRTEVSLDRAAQSLRVSRRLWPLMRKTVFSGPVDDVKSVRTKAVGDRFAVMLVRQDNSEVRIARTMTSVSADAVTAALKRKMAAARGSLS